MTPVRLSAALLIGAVLWIVAPTTQAQSASTPSDLSAPIDRLGAFDFSTRTEAARVVRRASPAAAIPALAAAARSHADGYVRFRALVILSGFGDVAAAPVMRDMLTDPNDRLRTVCFQWFEHHPNPTVLPLLIAALPNERSEFVRPALTRAIAAQGADARARQVLLPLVARGEDMFRGALIDALGDYRARYALPQILEVAQRDGPLQDDAITAIGRIGEKSATRTLGTLQRTAPRDVQPTIAAALCLLEIDCGAQFEYLRRTLASAVAEGDPPLLRGSVHGLSVLATASQRWALVALLDAGATKNEAVRAPVALGVGLVALRQPAVLVNVIESRGSTAADIEIVQDAFDMLSEDFEEEQFYVELRRESSNAPEASPRRRTANLLIEKLEF